jgi:hypothetical protein
VLIRFHERDLNKFYTRTDLGHMIKNP